MLAASGEEGEDVMLGGLDGTHEAARRKGLHEAAARGDQGAGVGEGEDVSHVSGDELADGMPEENVGGELPRLGEAEEGDFESKESGLSELGLVKRGLVGGQEDVAQGPVEVRLESLADGIECVAENGKSLVEGSSHRRALASLPCEEEGELATRSGGGPCARARSEVTLGECAEGGLQGDAVGRDEGGAVLEVGAGGGEGEGDVEKLEVGMGIEVLAKACGLRAEREVGLGREQERVPVGGEAPTGLRSSR